SFYIKDILDGGRGFSASVINRKQMPELGGGFKLKLLHQGYEGLVEPYVLLKGKTKWEEPGGLKAWMFPYILITVNSPGEYTIFNIRQVDIPSKDGVTDPSLQRFAQKYNLQTVFGSRTLYPGDYVSRDNAIILFEVVTGTENEVAGLSNPAKIRYYNLEQILPVSVIQPAINREQAASVAVEIYAYKSGISAEMIRPMTRRYIKNGDRMSDYAYHRLVIALDLGITRLEPDNTYDGAEKVTVEEMLKEIIVVLELLGEW
ncbi:MAG: S-layer protein, partial [Desulfitobacteriaceae bacterium]|nr:S-layer protein [Desulfitobacteriaceae bacterium]